MDSLIVFAKVPASGHVKTRLASSLSYDGAAALYAAMMADSLAAYRALGVDVRLYLADSPPSLSRGTLPDGIVPDGVPVFPQIGDDLGTRLASAFEETFAAGATRAVVIGTDHPTLPVSRVRAAFDALDGPDDLSVVPAHDGGFVLLGLRRSVPGLFTGRRYSHDAVFDELRDAARLHGLTVHRLDPWYDVDLPADLVRLRRDLEDGSASAPRTHAFLADVDARTP